MIHLKENQVLIKNSVNAEENNVNDENKYMVVTMKEQKKTLEYQETINLDIENISSLKQDHFGDEYMKLLMVHILK